MSINPVQKCVAVIAGDKTLDAVVLPGTTAEDVILELSLPAEYCLSKRDNLPFGDSEVIYALVNDGEKLYAVLSATTFCSFVREFSPPGRLRIEQAKAVARWGTARLRSSEGISRHSILKRNTEQDTRASGQQ